MNYVKKIIIFLALSSPSAAWSYCDVAGSLTINIPKITVQRDVAVGQPISEWFRSGNGLVYRNCNFDNTSGFQAGITNHAGRTNFTYGDGIVYKTNLPGVGVLVAGNTALEGQAWPGPSYDYSLAGDYRDLFFVDSATGYRPSVLGRAAMRFVKTGDITGGVLTGSYISLFAGARKENNWSAEVPVNITGAAAINVVACSVTTPNINVNLGEHKKSEFTGQGSSTAWTDVPVMLDCNTGASANIQIDGNADSSGAAGVMALDAYPDNTAASGLGIQIYDYLNAPVIFGKPLGPLLASASGPQKVALKARYYQTSEKVTAGKANGTATFTMTYK